jgi:hypothetical protein
MCGGVRRKRRRLGFGGVGDGGKRSAGLADGDLDIQLMDGCRPALASKETGS